MHPDLGGCLGTGCRVAYGHNFIENNGDPRDTCIGARPQSARGAICAFVVSSHPIQMHMAARAYSCLAKHCTVPCKLPG